MLSSLNAYILTSLSSFKTQRIIFVFCSLYPWMFEWKVILKTLDPWIHLHILDFGSHPKRATWKLLIIKKNQFDFSDTFFVNCVFCSNIHICALALFLQRDFTVNQTKARSVCILMTPRWRSASYMWSRPRITAAPRSSPNQHLPN